ncbi:MAG: addiction module protein [Myxococcales bacterium]|nr:addiction module protein [Myxococcales bacterium]
MTSAAQDLLEQAKKLSHDERQALAEALLDTLEEEPPPLSPEWNAEISSRIAQLERGEVQAVPWSEVQAQIRRTLGQG